MLIQYNLGVLAVGLGQAENAMKYFKAALEANPNIPQFWLSYIDALVKTDNPLDAKKVYNQAVKEELRVTVLMHFYNRLIKNSQTFLPSTESPTIKNILIRQI